MEAIEKAGYTPGKDIALALDVAATEFYKDGAYQFEGAAKSAAEMTAYYAELVAAYPLVSIEDPMSEEDWDGWKAITDALGAKVQLVGDDLFVTNPERLQRGIDTQTANALLVKVNQIGSLTETLDAVDLAHRNGYRCMMSHRSGETDHDSTAGWHEAFAAAAGTGLTVIPGMELSTNWGPASVHVLAYLFDPNNGDIVAETARIRDGRLHRAEQIVERGLSQSDAACSRTLDTFCALLGSFAGNVARVAERVAVSDWLPGSVAA